MRSEIRQCEFLVCHVSCSLTVKLESGLSNLWFYGVEQIGKTSFSEASYNGFKCKNYGYHTKLPINMDESCVNKLVFF